MDSVIFYQPLMTSKNQPTRLYESRTPSTIPGAPRTPSPFSQRMPQMSSAMSILTDHDINLSQDLDAPSNKSLSSTLRRGDNFNRAQENLIAKRNSLSSDDEDDLPDVDELLFGTTRKINLASPELDSDDCFIEIDDLSPNIPQNNVLATEGSFQGKQDSLSSQFNFMLIFLNPIIQSDDEPVAFESDTENSDLGIDTNLLHTAESETADDDDACRPRNATAPSYLVTEPRHCDVGNGADVNTILRPSADLSRSTSPRCSSTHQIEGVHWDSIPSREGKTFGTLLASQDFKVASSDALVGERSKDRDGFDARFTDRSPASADSDIIDDFQLQKFQRHHDLPPKPKPVAVSSHQSDQQRNGLSPKRLHGRDAAPKTSLKRMRIGNSTRSPDASSRESSTSELPSPRVSQSPMMVSDQEIVAKANSDDLDGRDRIEASEIAVSHPSSHNSPKRSRRPRDAKDMDVEEPAHIHKDPYQVTVAASSCGMQASEEILIHGSLTLKTVDSQVLYCLQFSQDLALCLRSKRQERTTASREPQSLAINSGTRHTASKYQRTRQPWTRKEDATLDKMKKKGCSWDEICSAIPHRSKGTLQVRYSTKLKQGCQI